MRCNLTGNLSHFLSSRSVAFFHARGSLILICALLFQVSQVNPSRAADELSGAKFRGKLSEMLQKTEKSIKIVSEQIAQSQNAPFLPDLYMQQADLFTEKSNTLYYIQMEKFHDTEVPKGTDNEFSPVVAAQKEAIGVYHLLLKDFQKYEKRGQVLYRLALALKSIDDSVEFVQIAGELIRKYGTSKESMGIRLMLAQYYFDKQEFKDALDLLKPVEVSPYVYERDLAKYRIGLIQISQEHCLDAMTQFEQVITDPALKEQENPYNVSIKTRGAKKSDLKREALIDSLRCFTRMPDKSQDPIGYYSRIAPSEIHFQEVIEKLALRYIYLKRYSEAIRLLRTLSERTSDPQKVVNIYRDVLVSIPPNDRITIPTYEIRFLLEKYNLWFSYFKLKPALMQEVFLFFEKQVRELGTTSHELAKKEQLDSKKIDYLNRARDFYLLYLGFFGKTKNSVEMAINLADVYFLKRDYVQSGDYYLRVFQGVYGQPTSKKSLIENALFCLQKKEEASFYDKIRIHGLLIEAVKSYFLFDRTKQNDPATNFVLVKARYEQGFFPEVLNELLAFMRRFNGTKQSTDAGELVLDYFNTRSDFAGMKVWTNKMLALRLKDQAFNQRLKQVSTTAQRKDTQEKLKSMAGYDDFAQGKSYLTLAMNSADPVLANSALKEALAKSRRERDIQTFLQVAEVMAGKERNPTQKAEILSSISREQNQITEYYKALNSLKRTYNNSSLSMKSRIEGLEDAVNNALLLKDWIVLGELLRNPLVSNLSASIKQRIKEQYADLLESPIPVASELERSMARVGSLNSADSLLSAYKGQAKLNPQVYAQISRQIAQVCAGGGNSAVVCRWKRLENADAKKTAFGNTLTRARPAVPDVEVHAQKFMALLGEYKALEGSGDLSLETILTLRNFELYSAFQKYLERVANSNPEVRSVLLQKAKETQVSADQYRQRCVQIARANDVYEPARRFCLKGIAPSVLETFRVRAPSSFQAPRKDLTSGRVVGNQRNIFGRTDSENSLMTLAREYLDSGYYHHSAAASAYGVGMYRNREDDFQTILGCSVGKLGLLNEARYHLKKGSSLDGLKEQCLTSIRQVEAAL